MPQTDQYETTVDERSLDARVANLEAENADLRDRVDRLESVLRAVAGATSNITARAGG